MLRLATLEWPPYVGQNLLHEGLTSYVIRNVAQQNGYQFETAYYPWSRAMMVGETMDGFVGYYPAYYSLARDHQCFLSNSLGNSVVGLAYLKGKRFDWTDLNSLRGLRIGVVQGYVNGDAFDSMVKNGKLKVDAAPSDFSNLRKLLADHIDVAVVEKSVLRLILSTDPNLLPYKDQILFHDKELVSLSLHICFRRTNEGRAAQLAFNSTLAKMDLQKLENTYFNELDSKSNKDSK